MPAPWENDPIAQSPQGDRIIAPADPYKQGAEARAQRKEERDVKRDIRDTTFDQTDKLGERFRGLDFVKEYPTVARQYSFALQTQPTPSGDQALIVAYAKMLDPGSVVREAEFDTTAAADSALGRTISRIKRELGLEGGGRLSEEARNKVRTEMRTLARQYDTQYQEARQHYTKMAQDFDLNPEYVVGSDYSQTYADVINSYWDDRDTVETPAGSVQASETFSTDEDRAVAAAVRRAYEGGGSLGDMIEASRALGRPVDIQQAKAWKEAVEYRDQTGKFAQVNTPRSGQASGFQQAATDFALSGPGAALTGVADFTGGLDEGAALVSSTLGGGSYKDELARINADKQTVQAANPGSYIAGQIGGGIVTGGIASRLAPGAASAATSTVGRTAGTSAIIGGTQGALENNDNRTLGAVTGAAVGGALGAGGAKLGNALASRAANRQEAGQVTNALADAGRAEDVTVNRAMADRSLENVVTAADAGRRGPQFRAGIDEVSGQIEGRVDNLSPIPNQNLSRENVGDLAQDALESVREKSGQQARAQYTRASKIAGNVRIQPTRAIEAIDAHIAELNDAGPSANKSLISYLEDVKSDLSREGGMSVDALRAQRTGLRGQINERNLTATDADRRVGEVLDAAAEDIAGNLDGKALAAFRSADNAWRERAQFIKQVERQLVGGDASNPISGDAAGRKIESWMRGDGKRLGKFWKSLDQEERDQIASSVAFSLGRNNAGDFTAAQFISQLTGKNRTISDSSIRMIFGEEGLQSINNLKLIAEEVKRVQGAMNSRSSGSGVASANDMRGWLINLLIQGGAIGGYAAGQDIKSAATGAAIGAAVVGGKAIRDRMLVRSLLSPRISNWVANAPKTANPKAIDAYFGRLTKIAGGNSAAAEPASWLARTIMGAANDNVGVAAAAEEPSQ